MTPGGETGGMDKTERAGEAVHDPTDIIHTHANVTGGWLRPAVFGAMDGLVSNFALIAGVAGGVARTGGGSGTVVLAGLAGLAAGAFSMAAGEYVSVASQSELAQAELGRERAALIDRPADEQEELAQLYMTRGVQPELARQVAAQLSSHPEQALVVHAREELGIDPADLPSPLLAAVVSFVAFAVGALWPLAPYLLGATSLTVTLVVSVLGMFAAGALVSRVTVRTWWWTGIRQLLLGGTAAALTYGFGALVGAGLG
jgi:VIT1/CCC1 family predicted Fe2+/Mn2+ transporter